MCKHGNLNVLTRDKGISRLGQVPSARTCLIAVEIFGRPLPPVSADNLTEIIRRAPPAGSLDTEDDHRVL